MNGILLGLLLVFGPVGIALAADAYDTPITQADDTASEMGRQNDEYNARELKRETEIYREEDQADKIRALEERLNGLEQHDKEVERDRQLSPNAY